MNLKANWIFAGLVGFTGAISAVGWLGGLRFAGVTNNKSCELQTLEQIRKNHDVQSNGTSSYNVNTEKCEYNYTSNDGTPLTLSWNP